MNTNQLKKFAQEARRKLIDQVSAKLNYVLTSDSAELREKGTAVQKLKEALKDTSKEQLIDKVAYTWFNRFVALRFMDANDYQPIGIKVLSPLDGFTTPEILDEAKRGHIHDELQVDRRKIGDLLDGRIPSSNAQNEVYKLLLTGVCNHLHKTFPFLFERIDDYTELLLPDDLISEFSIIQDIRNGMSKADCTEVEIIGWLYQFYISEWNEELISSKKKYKKDELAPASQLFTPKWIVEYMVDNTLGQLWLEISPNTTVLNSLQYYIKPSYSVQRERKSVEEIKFFEPCVGSGHILSYAFDVFYKIYEEEGYNPSEIPELILTKNLYGIDIDQRAAQLASFVLMMKAREKSRRFFRKEITPNISYYQDFEFDEKFNHATALGSLIKVDFSEYESFQVDENSLFSERQKELKKLYRLLGQRYDVVVTNPPYISNKRIEKELKSYLKSDFEDFKTDLFSAFIKQCFHFVKINCFVGIVSPSVWLTIKSYSKLRNFILEESLLTSLVKPSYTSFYESAVVPLITCCFIKGEFTQDSIFFDLGYLGSGKEQPGRLKSAISEENKINVDGIPSKILINLNRFKKIEETPFAYDLSPKIIDLFSNRNIGLDYYLQPGLQTSDNNQFLRFWHEIEIEKFNMFSGGKWFAYNKGGSYRKWYGNHEYVVEWSNDGEKIKKYVTSKYEYLNGNIDYVIKDRGYYLKKSVSWSFISSGDVGFRYYPEGFIFDVAGSSIFELSESSNILNLLGVLNSELSIKTIKSLNPTLNIQVGNIANLPFSKTLDCKDDVLKLVEISKNEWDNYEKSWNFKKNGLIAQLNNSIENSFKKYKIYWSNEYLDLKHREETLNRRVNSFYDFTDDLHCLSSEKITLLKEETSIVNGELVFDQKEIFSQFMSYAVGCMFGRYSLDKEGLILANQGETLQNYFLKVEKQEAELSFVPDEDNIIPVLDDEWFEDDIVGRFHEFLRASFGDQNFEKNLSFVEESIGKDIRKYFVKDFYKDHIQRYKKRPIYWMFSSPKGSFNVLVYMHRYTPDTLNQVLNGYLNEYREKLKTRMETLDHLMISGSPSEHNKAAKEKDKIQLVLIELQEYEREVLYPLATERISIDLDDGVLVNYNKFGNAIAPVAGLNDKKAKEKVKMFDWIETSTIR